MNTDFVIFALSIFMLFFGWFIAYLHYRRKLIAVKAHLIKVSTEQILENRGRWYKYGVEDALKDPKLIKDVCNEYHHTHRP